MGGSSPAVAQGVARVQGVESVQYHEDSPLTVYDLIDSDRDRAEEILAGAEHTRMVADRCEEMESALDAMRVELEERKVPGLLMGWCIRLIEKAGRIKGLSQGLAEGLPRASEAIAHAGEVAAYYDKQPADTVRDLGHAAPADASYHQE